MHVCGVIPARGGSKGVPRKNIKVLGGKPLVAHAIEVARRTPSLTRVVVSTEDEEIAEVARAWGGDVPFLRPRELAQDATPMLPVLRHALQFLEKESGRTIDAITVLDPTVPFRLPLDVESCIEILASDPKATVATSVCVAEHNPYFYMAEPDGPYLKNIANHHYQFTRRQDAPCVYREISAATTIRRQVIMERDGYYFEPPDFIRYYEIPPERAVMIDTPMDFAFAEFLLEHGIVRVDGMNA